MDQHKIELPRIVFVGRGAIEKLPELCKELGLRGRPLVITGENTRGIAGDRVAGLLSALKPKLDIAKEASYAEVERIRIASRGFFDFVIGTGGGKVIDSAKLLAFEEGAPFISIPTAPSHDGIASDRVSITEKNERHSVMVKPPVAILADIGILSAAPYRMIASGCADIISNYTAVYDWGLGKKQGEYYSEYAASLSLLSAEIVMNSTGLIKNREERGIRNLMEALVSSGIAMSLAGSSRPGSVAEHMFSHALDAMGSGNMHGEQCGIGAIIMAYMQGSGWKLVRDRLAEVGAPVTAKELGLSEEMIVKAVLGAKGIRKRHTILDEKPADEKMVLDVCRAVGVL